MIMHSNELSYKGMECVSGCIIVVIKEQIYMAARYTVLYCAVRKTRDAGLKVIRSTTRSQWSSWSSGVVC